MTYGIGAAAGAVFGGAIGLIKYILLWRPIAKGLRTCDAKHIYGNIMISMLIDAAVLMTVYFLRHVWPYSFTATIIGAALALSLSGKLFPLKEALSHGTAATQTDANEDDLGVK
ncbi:MAG: hypothetical protein K6B40_01855 [Firmicutes bacterium]|nr:hypothetical protein [Bacillota bacterium]